MQEGEYASPPALLSLSPLACCRNWNRKQQNWAFVVGFHFVQLQIVYYNILYYAPLSNIVLLQ